MFSGQLVKTDGKLVYTDNKDKLLYELFIDKLIDGEEVEIFISVMEPHAVHHILLFKHNASPQTS